MWCFLNRKTNERSHVRRCSALPALIPVCLSSEQAWMDYSAKCIWQAGSLKKKKNGDHLFHHG